MQVTLAATLCFSASAFVAPSAVQKVQRLHSEAVEETPEAPPMAPPPGPPAFDVKQLAGVSGPFGYFDPVGFEGMVTEKRMKYFREAELKHSRVAMLAAAGFLVGEVFHPLFGGAIDVPSYVAYQQTPLQQFWPVVVLYIGVIEIFSVFTFASPFDGNLWTLRDDRVPGDFDFDPLDLGPTDKAEMKVMQTKELNNGRTAMIAIAGMVAQELVSGSKLF
jgi:light-harvesting complex I chlorophyll a/b binding protein 4